MRVTRGAVGSVSLAMAVPSNHDAPCIVVFLLERFNNSFLLPMYVEVNTEEAPHVSDTVHVSPQRRSTTFEFEIDVIQTRVHVRTPRMIGALTVYYI